MSLSHAGPLNNAQRSSQNKPLPWLLAPAHLSPLSGASPTQATRTKKIQKIQQHPPSSPRLALCKVSLDVQRNAVNWSHISKVRSCLWYFLVHLRLCHLSVLSLILHFSEFTTSCSTLGTWNATLWKPSAGPIDPRRWWTAAFDSPPVICNVAEALNGADKIRMHYCQERARAPPGPAARSLSVNDSVLGLRQRGAMRWQSAQSIAPRSAAAGCQSRGRMTGQRKRIESRAIRKMQLILASLDLLSHLWSNWYAIGCGGGEGR